MRITFMGTPDFAVPSLELLARDHEVTLVVTRPDAVRGRGRELVPSPVKARALELGLPVLEARRATPEVLDAVREARPDVMCVAAFGCILPDELLAMAPLGCVNVHGSTLPRWRGAAPIQRAILEGDERVGVSIMRVVHDLDAGAYCRQAEVEVGEKGCAELMSELAEVGARELVAALAQMEAGTAAWVEQDPALVTYAAKIAKAEMLLDPADAVLVNLRRVQASTDAAPARLEVAGRGLRVMTARRADETVPAGEVVVDHGRVLLGCVDGSIEPLVVRPDGKRQMEARAWASGLRGSLAWKRA